jgi:enoyl-CoA hydratase/carnithine racemase
MSNNTPFFSQRRAFSDTKSNDETTTKGVNGEGGSSNQKNDNDHEDSSITSRRVTVDIDSKTGICHVELNRPEKLNAVDLPMFESIAQTAHQLQSDKSVRAVILSGKGRSFCTGLDVSSVMKRVGSPTQGPLTMIERLLERPSGYGQKQIGNLAQDVAMLWRELPVPVIAVLHGHCYGAGLQIALGADFRYCHPNTKLSVMEGKWGLIPDMGASVLLRETIGRIDICKELTMTGRIVESDEASKIGLVTRVCTAEEGEQDPMEEATNLAKILVERSPDSLAAAKQLYQNTWTMDEADALKEETRLQRKLLVSWNQMAASGRSALGWKIPYLNRKD